MKEEGGRTKIQGFVKQYLKARYVVPSSSFFCFIFYFNWGARRGGLNLNSSLGSWQ
jgi:hypothetical protein